MITIGIPTRNRLNAILRCLESCRILAPILHEIIVIDDCSDLPVEAQLRASPAIAGLPLRVIRQSAHDGNGQARNTIAAEAKTNWILYVDDDTKIFALEPVLAALQLLQRDPTVAAVAFAQAESDGRPWGAQFQPAPVSHPCLILAFIGFGVLFRKAAFLSVNGYRTIFLFYGEEKELSLRLHAANWKIVYLPDARIAHMPDPGGRDQVRYLRYYHRNDCIAAIYNYPLPHALALVAYKLLTYPLTARRSNVRDKRGVLWIIGELWKHRQHLWQSRKPVSLKTYQSWRALRKTWPAYASPV